MQSALEEDRIPTCSNAIAPPPLDLPVRPCSSFRRVDLHSCHMAPEDFIGLHEHDHSEVGGHGWIEAQTDGGERRRRFCVRQINPLLRRRVADEIARSDVRARIPTFAQEESVAGVYDAHARVPVAGWQEREGGVDHGRTSPRHIDEVADVPRGGAEGHGA